MSPFVPLTVFSNRLILPRAWGGATKKEGV